MMPYRVTVRHANARRGNGTNRDGTGMHSGVGEMGKEGGGGVDLGGYQWGGGGCVCMDEEREVTVAHGGMGNIGGDKTREG